MFSPVSPREHAALAFAFLLFATDAAALEPLPAGLERAFGRTLAKTQTKLVAADGANGDRFGVSVAIDGDTALVGALLVQVGDHFAQGAAYVFVRSGDAWTLQTRLVAEDGQAFDRFGASVALSGDTALIGAWGADASRGAAWVFTRSGTTWTQQAKLSADDGEANDFFGEAIALDGDAALIGAWGCDIDGDADQGAAYVFTRSGGAWAQRYKFIADDGEPNDSFGEAVALSNGAALIGSRFAKVGDNFLQGAVYAATGEGGDWSALAKLIASDGAPLDRFGFSVAADGDTAIIGALGGNEDRGAAYMFTRTDEGWAEQTKLGASDGAQYDDFGQRVAIAGDAAIVGADFVAVDGRTLQGAAYVFTRSGTTWNETAKLVAEDGAENDSFGCAVAIDARTAFVGAWLADVDGTEDRGAAYLFEMPLPDAIFADGFD